MIVYQCAKCGAGELEPLGDGRKAMCVYCNAVMVLPQLNPESFNQANQLRLQRRFDEAEMVFEQIVLENPDDCESYWNLLLSRYGIEYVADRDGTMVPTCHRLSYQSMQADPDFHKAMECADAFSQRLYRSEAEKIDRIMKRAAQIAQTQPAYDVFISYKDKDENGHRTEDSVIAQDLYDALKEKHPQLNIFLSRVTLAETAAGLEYEPVIFSALHTARVMILVGTCKAHLESVWVRSEWSRYRRMMDQDPNKKMAVVYQNLDPAADLPAQLRLFSIQATQAAGFYQQDFIAGMEQLLGLQEAQTVQVYRSSVDYQVEKLLEEAENALELGDLDEARSRYEDALERKADCAAAWFGLVRVETEDLTFVDDSVSFYLSDGAQRHWERAKRYAADRERAEFSKQMRDYRKRWKKAAENREHDAVQAARKRQVDADFEELYRVTENGTRFEQYEKYGMYGSFSGDLFLAVRPDRVGELTEFLDRYQDNYEAYDRLQALKRSNPVAAIEKEPDCVKLKQEMDEAKQRVELARSRVNGVSIFNLCFAALIAAAAWYFGDAQRAGALRVTYHLVPLLVSLLAVSTLLFVVIRDQADESGFANELAMCIYGALPALIVYFVIQYVIVRQAQAIAPNIPTGAMFIGVVSLLMLIGVVGTIILLFVNWVGAAVFLAADALIAVLIQKLFSIEEISGAVLQQIQQPLFRWLLIASLVCLAVRAVKWMWNLGAMTQLQIEKENLESKEKSYQKTVNEKLDTLKKPYIGHVASCYLEDMTKLD